MSLHVVSGVLEQGLLYSLVVMAVFFTSRVIRFDDLTVEGSFGLGGALASQVFLLGWSPWLSLPIALAGGAACGVLTAALHVRLGMNNLISGLVVTTALFSVALNMAGSNVVIGEGGAVFDVLPPLVVLPAAALAAWGALELLLRSEVGLLLRTVGCNPQMITNLGRRVGTLKMVALMISNALTALAGALFVQWSGFFSITSNVGTLIIGLAGLILGETVRPRFGWNLIVGAILYQALFALTVELHLSPVWNNLIKAGLIVLLIQIGPGKTLVTARSR